MCNALLLVYNAIYWSKLRHVPCPARSESHPGALSVGLPLLVR